MRDQDEHAKRAKEGTEEEIVAATTTETGATSGRRRLSMGNIRLTLGPVPSSYPVLRSCTIHLE